MANINTLLSPQQQTFVNSFAKSSGYDPAVVGAWVRNEEPLLSQNTDPAGHGRYNFLNIGITDSQPYGANAGLWKDPATAGALSGQWATGQYSVPGYGKAASSLVAKLRAAQGKSAADQIAAIQTSGWASGGEKALPSLYQQFSGVTIPQTTSAGTQQLSLGTGTASKATQTAPATQAATASTNPQAPASSFLDFLTAKQQALGKGQTAPTLTSFLNQSPLPSTGSGSALLGYIQNGERTTSAPTAVTVQAAKGTKATPTATAAIDVAKQYIGTPYKFGGADPNTGFDCSGLVQYSFGKQGIQVPRTSQEQWKFGKPVNKSQMSPGDVVFFAGSDGTMTDPGHEGIYLGNDQFLEAPHTGDVVKVAKLSTRSDFVGARTFT